MPADADRVQVGVQHQRAATTRAAGDRDDIGAARAKLGERRLEPRSLAPLGDEPRERDLPEPPATTSGLIDSIATSCAASSATSLTYATYSSAIASVSSRMASPSSTSSRVTVNGGTTMTTFQCVMR